MPKRESKTTKSQKTLKLDNCLVLFRYILALFGKKTFNDLAEELKDPALEGFDEENHSKFARQLILKLPKEISYEITPLTKEDILRYDEHIVSHTLKINESRRKYEKEIKWRYFQYLAILFTEIYLDRLFTWEKGKFRGELNFFLEQLKNEEPDFFGDIDEYKEDDLRKISFWMATGSGKTLLMHMNFLQIKYYLEKTGELKNIKNFILLTPNPGLSIQHLKEFYKSGIPAEIFTKQSGKILGKGQILILDLYKLREEGKDKTISVDEFENSNFVLIDEGHKGAGGIEWFDLRERLCENGYSFEYSATFGQAVKPSSKHFSRYAKNIIFDYSYKYFYEDGYGKDYRILNLEKNSYRDIYLTAGLITFYQQIKLYYEKSKEFAPFNIEKPLWIFIAGKVTKTTSKQEISDVLIILEFFSDFLNNEVKYKKYIEDIILGKSGIKDTKGKELFPQGYFKYIPSSAEDIYNEILNLIFNTKTPGKLHIVNLTSSEGEIGLKVGNNDYFGVINIGDISSFIKLCQEENKGNFLVDPKDPFTPSLFHQINQKDSRINILIGARKFVEGWNSWRVSMMGLINFGKSEGPLVIQLFGRGVRLKGYEWTLKRSKALISGAYSYNISIPSGLEELETLHIFGVKADYIAHFREYLEKEGVPTDKDKTFECVLPVVISLPENCKLFGIRLKQGISFRKKAGCLRLKAEPHNLIKKRKITLDLSPKIETVQSEGVQQNVPVSPPRKFLVPDNILELIDWEAIYNELVHFKYERGWRNLLFDKQTLIDLMKNGSWYEIYAASDFLEIKNFKDIFYIQNVVTTLLKKYLDRYYRYHQMDWEKNFVEHYEINASDANFDFINDRGGYEITVSNSDSKLLDDLQKLYLTLYDSKDHISDYNFCNYNCKAIFFKRHLYQPLLFVSKNFKIKVSPVALNESERCFVECLRAWCQDERYERLKNKYPEMEIYLLRNLSQKGIGFLLESGKFFPDFILWVCTNEVQYINFIEPKGLHNISLDDPKIEFYKTIKEIEKKLNVSNNFNNIKIVLNSFIISPTPINLLVDKRFNIDELEKRHVFFMNCDEILAFSRSNSLNCEQLSCKKNCYIDKIFKCILK